MRAVVFCIAVFVGAQTAFSAFIGPDSVSALLHRKKEMTFRDRLDRLQARTGLKLGGDYNMVGFASVDGKQSAGGVARLYGELSITDSTTLVFKAEHRGAFGAVSPVDFGLETGYVGLMQSTFSDQGGRVTNLYFKRKFFDGRGLLYAGYLDVTDYTDVYLLASPWESFGNLVFATGSGTIGGLPDGALGVMAGAFVSDSLYIVGSIVDAGADATDPFRTPFRHGESFSTLEAGLTPGAQRFFFDNVHITLWHQSERKSVNIAEGYGVAFSMTTLQNERNYYFVRGGFGHGGGALLSRSLSVGYGYMDDDGVAAIGVNVSRPNDDTFEQANRTQYTLEGFYRFQVTKGWQITPSIQYVYHPALNDSRDFLTVFGLRIRGYF